MGKILTLHRHDSLCQVGENAKLNLFIGTFLREYLPAAESMGISRVDNKNCYELSFYRSLKLSKLRKSELRRWASRLGSLPYERWLSLLEGTPVPVANLYIQLIQNRALGDSGAEDRYIPEDSRIILIQRKNVQKPTDLILRGLVTANGLPLVDAIQKLAERDKKRFDALESSIAQLIVTRGSETEDVTQDVDRTHSTATQCFTGGLFVVR